MVFAEGMQEVRWMKLGIHNLETGHICFWKVPHSVIGEVICIVLILNMVFMSVCKSYKVGKIFLGFCDGVFGPKSAG